MFSFLLKTIQWLNINFFADVLGISIPEGYLAKKTVSQHLPLCWKSSSGILRLILGYVSLFLYLRTAPSYLMKFRKEVSCITLTVNVLIKPSQCVSLNWGHFAVFLHLFWVYSCMPWETNISYFIFCTKVVILCGHHLAKKCVGSPSYLDISGCFGSIWFLK